jgi:hypothetical protein
MVRRSVFDKLFGELQRIDRRLTEIEKQLTVNNVPTQLFSENLCDAKLLKLPDNLRRSYLAVIGECTATDVSVRTGINRSVESMYLNQLVREGWLSKRRIGRLQYFRLVGAKVQVQIEETKPHLEV